MRGRTEERRGKSGPTNGTQSIRNNTPNKEEYGKNKNKDGIEKHSILRKDMRVCQKQELPEHCQS